MLSPQYPFDGASGNPFPASAAAADAGDLATASGPTVTGTAGVAAAGAWHGSIIAEAAHREMHVATGGVVPGMGVGAAAPSASAGVDSARKPPAGVVGVNDTAAAVNQAGAIGLPPIKLPSQFGGAAVSTDSNSADGRGAEGTNTDSLSPVASSPIVYSDPDDTQLHSPVRGPGLLTEDGTDVVTVLAVPAGGGGGHKQDGMTSMTASQDSAGAFTRDVAPRTSAAEAPARAGADMGIAAVTAVGAVSPTGAESADASRGPVLLPECSGSGGSTPPPGTGLSQTQVQLDGAGLSGIEMSGLRGHHRTNDNTPFSPMRGEASALLGYPRSLFESVARSGTGGTGSGMSGGVGASSALFGSGMPSVLLSVMRQENIDYENDFYWMDQFHHERLRGGGAGGAGSSSHIESMGGTGTAPAMGASGMRRAGGAGGVGGVGAMDRSLLHRSRGLAGSLRSRGRSSETLGSPLGRFQHGQRQRQDQDQLGESTESVRRRRPFPQVPMHQQQQQVQGEQLQPLPALAGLSLQVPSRSNPSISEHAFASQQSQSPPRAQLWSQQKQQRYSRYEQQQGMNSPVFTYGRGRRQPPSGTASTAARPDGPAAAGQVGNMQQHPNLFQQQMQQQQMHLQQQQMQQQQQSSNAGAPTRTSLGRLDRLAENEHEED